MTKQIFFDARHLHSGIGSYIRGVLGCFKDKELPFRLVLIGNREILGKAYPNFECINSTTPIYTLKEQLEIPLLTRKADLLHVPHFNAPFYYSGKLVTTIYDVMHLSLPHLTENFIRRTYAQLLYGNAIRRSAKIFTISNFSKSEIIRCTGADSEKIIVSHCGIDDQYRCPVDQQKAREIAARLGVKLPFVIYVGNFKPQKNLPFTIQTFMAAKEEYFLPHSLVLVGSPDPKFPIPIPAGVSVLSGISNADLAGLFRAADALVQLSNYEGFGLPPLEAMAQGTPSLVSDIPVFKEIYGDTVFYTKTNDPNDAAGLLNTLLTDHQLRSGLISKGPDLCRRFRWENTAEKLLEAYVDLLEI